MHIIIIAIIMCMNDPVIPKTPFFLVQFSVSLQRSVAVRNVDVLSEMCKFSIIMFMI